MRRFFILPIFFLLFSGCTYSVPAEHAHVDRVVTQVTITATQGGKSLVYQYTDPDKMGAVLTYLRTLDATRSAPIAPETFRTPSYQIQLTLSDGSQTIYRQLHDSYLQKNDGPWHMIDPPKGATLLPLLRLMPSDNV